MSESVLIATPARTGTPRELLMRNEALVHRFTYPAVEWRLHLNDPIVSAGKYEPNAWARNFFINRFLAEQHGYVLWLDVDVIDAPADLIERLMAVSLAHERAIVAPMVWMERVKEGAVNLENGGWFYDTGGFVDLNGQTADFFSGPPGADSPVALKSVGTVYLAPAELYRRGLRYRPVGNEVEHLSFCRDAAAAGTKVLACRDISVTHAYLPKYGDVWHSS
jgi:hypothetical protein